MGYQINSYYKSQYTGQQIENALSAFKNMAAEYSQNESYNVGDVVLYGNGLYVCTGSTTGAFDPSKWQQTTLAEIFANLGSTYSDPDNNGNVVIGVDSTVGEKILRSLTFPGLTNRYYLPFAQYIRERLQNDPSAASFSIEIPDAEEAPMHSTVIKGKTVAQNQLVEEPVSTGTYIGLTITNNGDGSVTVTGTPSSTASSIIPSNKYAKTVTGHTLYVFGGDSVVRLRGYSYRNYADSDSGNGIIITAASENEPRLAIMCPNTTTEVNAKIYPQCADLSLYFTAAELSTIGTDVSTMKAMFLKKYGYPFPKYIAPNAGSLANVNGVYRLRRKNLFDKSAVTTGVGLSDDGTTYSTANYFVSDYTKVEPSTVYYFNNVRKSTSGNAMCWYDANKNFIKYDRMSSTSDYASGDKTAPENAVYVRVSSATAILDGCGFNVYDSAYNGTVEPYYNGGTIDCSTAPLNGIGTAQDEKNFATGKRTTKVLIADLAAMTWQPLGTNGRLYSDAISATVKNMASTAMANIVAAKYPTVTASALAADDTLVGIAINGTNIVVRTPDGNNPTGDLCYELATPVVTTETPQPVYTQYGYNVFEPVSGGVQSAEVDTVYYENIAGYIDKKLAEG